MQYSKRLFKTLKGKFLEQDYYFTCTTIEYNRKRIVHRTVNKQVIKRLDFCFYNISLVKIDKKKLRCIY